MPDRPGLPLVGGLTIASDSAPLEFLKVRAKSASVANPAESKAIFTYQRSTQLSHLYYTSVWPDVQDKSIGDKTYGDKKTDLLSPGRYAGGNN